MEEKDEARGTASGRRRSAAKDPRNRFNPIPGERNGTKAGLLQPVMGFGFSLLEFSWSLFLGAWSVAVRQ
jgi:hypothetical protein